MVRSRPRPLQPGPRAEEHRAGAGRALALSVGGLRRGACADWLQSASTFLQPRDQSRRGNGAIIVKTSQEIIYSGDSRQGNSLQVGLVHQQGGQRLQAEGAHAGPHWREDDWMSHMWRSLLK